MKLHKLTFLSSIISLASFQATASDFVRQTDFDSPDDHTDIYVQGPEFGAEKSGSIGVNDILPVGSKGAKFELYAVDLETGTLIHEPLDSKLVGLKIPKAEITLSSQDLYNDGVIRTRADEPYYAKVEVSDLSEVETDPESAKKVYIERLFAEYTDDDRLPINGDSGFSLINTAAFDSASFEPANGYMKANGYIEGTFTTAMEEPSESEFFKQKGEELVRVYAQPSEDSPWEVVAEKKVQIWPVATAAVTAVLESGQNLPIQTLPITSLESDLDPAQFPTVSTIPTFTIELSDLYPTSSTYAVIYRIDGTSAARSDISQDILANEVSSLNFNTVTPQGGTITISPNNWDPNEMVKGYYIMEVRTVTPFNGGLPENLSPVGFKFQPTVTIKATGSLTTAE